MGVGREASAERPAADLPQLRRVWSGWKGAEEDSGLIYEVGEGVAAFLSAEDIVEGVVPAKVTLACGRVKGALGEDVFVSKVMWG
jgi:hypothetical protein